MLSMSSENECQMACYVLDISAMCLSRLSYSTYIEKNQLFVILILHSFHFFIWHQWTLFFILTIQLHKLHLTAFQKGKTPKIENTKKAMCMKHGLWECFTSRFYLCFCYKDFNLLKEQLWLSSPSVQLAVAIHDKYLKEGIFWLN